MDGLPAGQMSFLLRAGSDTLPTPLNLKRWRLRMDSTCPLCGHTQSTIHHILSSCPEALQQGRYTWRHDSALQILVKYIKEHLDCNTTLYADLPGMRASENPVATIPDDTLVTSAQPDIVLVGEDEVTLLMGGARPHARKERTGCKPIPGFVLLPEKWRHFVKHLPPDAVIFWPSNFFSKNTTNVCMLTEKLEGQNTTTTGQMLDKVPPFFWRLNKSGYKLATRPLFSRVRMGAAHLVTLIELTIPHNSLEDLSNARGRKSQKDIYLHTLSDLAGLLLGGGRGGCSPPLGRMSPSLGMYTCR